MCAYPCLSFFQFIFKPFFKMKEKKPDHFENWTHVSTLFHAIEIIHVANDHVVL